MTSELRPVVEVATDCYEQEFFGIEAAAAVIEADREAVRAEQAAEIERLKSHLEDAKEIIQKQIKQAAELAKFKALAEELARALARCWRIVERHNWRQSEKVDDVKQIAAEALRQYEEARDAS